MGNGQRFRVKFALQPTLCYTDICIQWSEIDAEHFISKQNGPKQSKFNILSGQPPTNDRSLLRNRPQSETLAFLCFLHSYQ